MSIGIEFIRCNDDSPTCPVYEQLIEVDRFCEQMSEVSPASSETRKYLGMLADACAAGTCPGQNMKTTREVLRQIIDRREQ